MFCVGYRADHSIGRPLCPNENSNFVVAMCPEVDSASARRLVNEIRSMVQEGLRNSSKGSVVCRNPKHCDGEVVQCWFCSGWSESGRCCYSVAFAGFGFGPKP